jgi:hypothetical protein
MGGTDIMGGRGFRHYSKVVWPGFSYTPGPRHVIKVGRNDPCPCGGGRKYKDCHESSGSAWLEKLARDQDKKRLAELRQEMKDRGVPWYKRLLVRG